MAGILIQNLHHNRCLNIHKALLGPPSFQNSTNFIITLMFNSTGPHRNLLENKNKKTFTLEPYCLWILEEVHIGNLFIQQTCCVRIFSISLIRQYLSPSCFQNQAIALFSETLVYNFFVLQDSNEREFIICDKYLEQIFSCQRMKFAEIPQRLNPLLHPPDPIVINHVIR